VLLGGRAAEKLVFDQLSTGAADDIARATDIARGMVMRYGMDEDLGCVAYAENPSRFLDISGIEVHRGNEPGPDTSQRIDAAVRGIVQAAFENALTLLRDHRATLDRCAQALIDKETLDEAEIRQLSTDLRPAA
jgi:cell division protease FtsH